MISAHCVSLAVAGLVLMNLNAVFAFVVSPVKGSVQNNKLKSSLNAKPRRLEENVDGVVYVNDQCINCAACSNFAPSTFSRSKADGAHIVHHQPTTTEEIQHARSALAACPVAAIRLETKSERRHRANSEQDKALVDQTWTDHDELLVQQMSTRPKKDATGPFPRQFLDDDSLGDLYWLGHHNDKSFGATPYLLRSLDQKGKDIWIMIDTPRFSPSAVKAVESLTGPGKGPDYLFITHVDDSADHQKWAQHYAAGQTKRIFHAGDLGRHNWVGDLTLENVEILLPKTTTTTTTSNIDGQPLTAFDLDGNLLPSDWEQQSNDHHVVVLHTPGHSPGSITLYQRPNNNTGRPGIVFTGDTYGYTTRGGGKMTAFGQYGNDLRTQSHILQKLVDLDWQVVAPGHGHPRDYRTTTTTTTARRHEQEEIVSNNNRKQDELQVVLNDMLVSRRWR